MGFLDNITDRISSIFSGDNDELLFFIIVFLMLFSTNLQSLVPEDTDGGTGSILFFILLFLLLFLNTDRNEEVVDIID